MTNILFASIAFLSICAGLYAIIITHRLNKKYEESYLSSYLYFQIFINVFGLYGILGKELAQKILQEQQLSFLTIEKIGHFFTFLGIPFSIFAWYMFLRLSREIAEKKMSRAFTMGFFFVLSVVYFIYGAIIILLNVTPLTDDQFIFCTAVLTLTNVVLELSVFIIALLWLFWDAKKIGDAKKKNALQIFAELYMMGFGLSIVVCILAWNDSAFAPVYYLVFILRNIPPLLFWKSYLQKHYVAPAIQSVEMQTWQQFLEEHKISKREEEVIRHLSVGKTNKEISDELFISLQTVKDHIYRIYQKTDVKNRVQLINLIQSYKKD